MKKNIITFGVLFFLLALFSSCLDKHQYRPISIIPDDSDRCGIHYTRFNNQLLAVSDSPANQIPFDQSLEIVPLHQAITEFNSQESINVTTPVILPPPSPYDKTEMPQEDQRPAVIVPPPPASRAKSSSSVTPVTPNTQKLFRVQIGAFNNNANIQRNVSLLRSAGFNPVLEKSGNFTRVVIPRVKANNLNLIINRLNRAGFTDTWVRNEL